MASLGIVGALAVAGLIGLAGIVAGGIAAVAGFGIGSILTPVLALETGTRLAVAAVALPHAIGTAQRLWLLRTHVDRRVLLGFGVASAAGGLVGAILHSVVAAPGLTIVFGAALVATGVAELTGWMRRVRWGRRAAWIAGLTSGLLGGLVGNQGSVRSAALLGFQVPKESFVATATAIALVVDAARLPVYLMTQGAEVLALWPLLATATAGVVIGTALGTRYLGRMDEAAFHRAIGGALLVLGAWIVLSGR